jgi:hypothetical protein
MQIKHKDGTVLVEVPGDTLRGADLGGAYLRGAYLRGADLRGAYLRGADLRGADLGGAYLRGAYLRGADLGGAYLRGADLGGAYLRGADLGGANQIPLVEHLHTKMLAAIEAKPELFDMSTWHSGNDGTQPNGACGTTHCRAGWAIHLAGAPGYALEKAMGPSVAGALIIARSCPYLEVTPDFMASNEDALDNIRACAAKEAEVQP